MPLLHRIVLVAACVAMAGLAAGCLAFAALALSGGWLG